MATEIISNPADENTRRRKVWVAVLFSLLLPGLGQMYNGQLRKGQVFYLSGGIFGILLFALACKTMSLVLIASVLLIQFSIQLAAAIDGGRAAHPLFTPGRTFFYCPILH